MNIAKIVLLIDDDDLQMLEETLNIIGGGHKIIQANKGVEGLEVLDNLQKEKRLPCLIVFDINMPKMDGKQTFVAIKSNKKLASIPIVIFSTSTFCKLKMYDKEKGPFRKAGP